MTARPMTEVEREAAVEAAERIKAKELSSHAIVAGGFYVDAKLVAHALLSTSASLRVMREALEKIAKQCPKCRGSGRVLQSYTYPSDGYVSDYWESCGSCSEVRAALSGIEPGDEQARSASHRSAPASTISKDTTK